MSEYAIETQNLCKKFDNDLIIDNLNIQIPKGSIFGLLGPNGAGKTTLIRTLMGILRPTSGSARLLGYDAFERSGEVRRYIGYVSDYQYMYPSFKVSEMVKFCSMLYPNWNNEKCAELIKKLELPLNKSIRSLSKGMKTQFAIIIALSTNPKLLILDEPTSGLDPAIRKHLLKTILEDASENEITIFFSTHNMGDLERMADKVGLMMKGKLLFNNSLDEVKQSHTRIQVVFDNELPEKIKSINEVLKYENMGRMHTFNFGCDKQKALSYFNEYNPVYLEALDMSLEDIFINIVEKEGYNHEEFNK